MSAIIPNLTPQNLQAALWLTEEFGLPVFAARPDKKPYTAHGFKDATCNIERVVEQFEPHPDALIAVPTGSPSKLLVVDIDPTGMQWYAEHAAELACGRVHNTRRGHHLLYRMPQVDIRNSASKIAPGVDVRAEGGYIIWWPAHGLETIGDLADITEPPAWLLDTLTIPERKPASKLNGSGIPDGARNATLTSLAGKMRRAGASQGEIEIALGVLNGRCEPPLLAGELHSIATSVARYSADASNGVDLSVRPESKPLDWRVLEPQTTPERSWAIEHWFGMGHVTLLAGAGGAGKTNVAQTVGSCLALRREYLDWLPAERRVLLWACEDDADELWRRQVAIAKWLEVPLSAFADRLFIHSYDGEEVALAGLCDQRLVPTPMLTELREQIGDYQADVVLLDNVARLYAGNENDRHQVTSFIAMLTRAAAPTKAAVMLLGHPGKAVGSEYSGSTAWEGAVRARLYLGRTLPDAEKPEQDEAADDGMRYLCRRKANYSARDFRRLQFRDGVMVPDAPLPQSAGKISTDFARDVVTRAVRKLAEMSQYGVTFTGSPNYLPKLAQQYNLLENLTKRDFEAAMRVMQKDKALVMAVVGQYANRSKREALVLPEPK